MSAEPAFPGTDLVESAFAEGYVGGLGTAMARLQAAQGRPVVLTLAAGIRPWRWAETRSAVGALREQGAVALSAAPVVAAWLVLSAGGAEDPGEQYAVHDALLALADLHPDGRRERHGGAGDAVVRIATFFAEAVDPHLLALFALPTQVWHRGLVTYFGRHPTSPDLLAGALQSLISRDDPAPAGEERWFEYTRAEALSLLGRIGPSIELAQLERLWRADAAIRTIEPGEFHSGEVDPGEVNSSQVEAGEVDAGESRDDDPLAVLIALASDPEPSVRIEALSGLARQGGRDPRLLDLAMRASRSSDPGERRAAARLLASFGDQSAG